MISRNRAIVHTIIAIFFAICCGVFTWAGVYYTLLDLTNIIMTSCFLGLLCIINIGCAIYWWRIDYQERKLWLPIFNPITPNMYENE
jgi:hypothetical protein